jgi:Protein of unknown function (DUF1579)
MSSGDTPASQEPGPEHRRLDVFVGQWRTEGTILADPENPSGSTAKLTAVDTYEWLPGGFFLIHHVDGRMGEDEVHAIEIIGYDASRQAYRTRSFDNHGNTGTYEATLRGATWAIRGQRERFTGEFGDGSRTLTGQWQRRSADGARWVPWMDIRLTKAT